MRSVLERTAKTQGDLYDYQTIHFHDCNFELALAALLATQPLSTAADSKKTELHHQHKARKGRQKVELNTATKAELEALPGVGSATADAIIAARPFKSVQDLKNVPGIGESKYGQLRNEVTVSKTSKKDCRHLKHERQQRHGKVHRLNFLFGFGPGRPKRGQS